MSKVCRLPLILLCLFISKVYATNYYIRPIGSDTNSGIGITPETSWQTLNPINNKIFLAGDNIFIEGSYTYTGNISFNQSDKGTAANPITISSFGNGRASINSGTTFAFYGYNTSGIVIKNLNFTGAGVATNTNHGILFYSDQNISQLDYIKIDSISVSGYLKSGICVSANTSTNKGYANVRITNCLSYNNGEGGITLFGSDNTSSFAHKNCYIGFNTVHDITGRPEITNTHTGNGILVSAVDQCIIEYNSAYNNGALNGQNCGGPVGIWCFASTNVIIQYCESYNNKAGKSCDGGGFDLNGGTTNSILQYNYSHNNEGAGYLISQYGGASFYNNNTVRYNISENDGRKNGYAGILLSGNKSNGGINNTHIYNNTIYITPASPTMPSGIKIEGVINGSSIRNNIIQTTGGVSIITASTTSGILFQGNCYWSTGGAFTINWKGTNYTSLTNWRNATGQEKNGNTNTGFQVNPALTSPGNGGTVGDPSLLKNLNAYKLTSGSTIINAGLNLSSLFGINPGAKDFYGTAIPQGSTFEIGANEFIDNSLGCVSNGIISREEWDGITGTAVSAIPVNTTPTSSSTVSIFEGPVNIGDNYGARYKGYVCAPISGNYIFWISSNDNGELWLSTDENPANKIKIANVPGYTAMRQWDKYATQRSNSITLQAGHKYYIEALHKEGVGTDYVAAGWQLPNGTLERPIPGSRLSSFSNTNSFPSVSITSPTNGQFFLAPAAITINVSASDSDGSIFKVEFFNGSTKLGEDLTEPYSFQWMNVAAGSYTLNAKATDNGNLQTTSSPVTVNVQSTSGCTASGFLNRELWTNISGNAVSSIPLNQPPNSTSQVNLFEGPTNVSTNYGARYRGYICVPITGNYTFWVASNDNSELWLSTNDNPASKVKIASVTGFTDSRIWNKYASQQSPPISLIAGQRYYIEALHKQGLGTDNLAVGWQLPNGQYERPILGNRISPFVTSLATINQVLLRKESNQEHTPNDTIIIKTYPNPAQRGFITLEILGYETKTHEVYIEVKNNNGDPVYSQPLACEISCKRTIIPINEKFISGTYIINVLIDNQRYSERILIE